MADLVKGLANIPAKLFHEKRNLLTFLDTLIKYGISRDLEGIEVLLVGSNRDGKKKLTKLFKDIDGGKNGQNQMKDEETLRCFLIPEKTYFWIKTPQQNFQEAMRAFQ